MAENYYCEIKMTKKIFWEFIVSAIIKQIQPKSFISFIGGLRNNSQK